MATSLRGAGKYTGLTFFDQTTLLEYGPEEILKWMLLISAYVPLNNVASKSRLGRSSRILKDNNLPRERVQEEYRAKPAEYPIPCVSGMKERSVRRYITFAIKKGEDDSEEDASDTDGEDESMERQGIRIECLIRKRTQ